MLNMARNITRDIPVLAGIYAGQYDCEIKIGGSKAFATNKMIQIPYPKEETLDLTWCFVVHEAAHIRYSNFEYLEQWLNTKPKSDRKFYKKLLNIVEDTYIEKLILTEFPGSMEYLEAGGKYLEQRMQEQEVTAENALSRFIFLYVRGYLTGYRSLQAQYKVIRKQCILHFGLPLVRELSKILERTLTSTCTSDNCKIVDDFVSFLENPQIEEEDTSESQENSSSEPHVSDDGETSEDSHEQNVEDELEEETLPESDDQSSEDESTDGQSNEASNPSDLGSEETESSDQPDTNSESSDSSSSNNVESSIDETSGDNQTQTSSNHESINADDEDSQSSRSDKESAEGGKPDGRDQWSEEELRDAITEAMERLLESETDVSDMIKEVIESEENIDHEASQLIGADFSTVSSSVSNQPLNTHNSLSRDTSQATAALKQKLAALVAHKTRTKKTVEKRGRRFARGKMHRLSVGNPAIFSRKTRDEKKPNSSIVILVDDSGSIGNHLPDMQKATLALIEALDSQKGVKVSAIAFGSEFGGTGQLTRLKLFSERGDVVINRIAALTANGGTPLLNGLKAAKQDLYGVKNRKLVIVLTDGQPNDMPSCINYIKEMQSSNITLVGVGIGNGVSTAAMQAQYGHSNYTLVPQFELLPQAVMELSKQIMLD